MLKQEAFAQHTNMKAPPWVCWPWLGPLDSSGVGRVVLWKGTPPVSARRMSYEIHIGPIPIGKPVLLSCKNAACVNPAHMYISRWREKLAEKREKARCGPVAPTGYYLVAMPPDFVDKRTPKLAVKKKSLPPRKDGRPRIKFKTFRDGKWRR
jgi:hypothetical protein